jgi:phosphatidylinositol glycan class A protein
MLILFFGVSRMISDFFHPVAGGVEGAIYYLSVELIRRGHKVCPLPSFLFPLLTIPHLV